MSNDIKMRIRRLGEKLGSRQEKIYWKAAADLGDYIEEHHRLVWNLEEEGCP